MSYLISLHLFSPFQLNHAPHPSKWIIITYNRQSTLFLNLFIYFFRSKGVSRKVRGKRAFPALRTQTERVQFSWLSRIQSTAQKVGLHSLPFSLFYFYLDLSFYRSPSFFLTPLLMYEGVTLTLDLLYLFTLTFVYMLYCVTVCDGKVSTCVFLVIWFCYDHKIFTRIAHNGYWVLALLFLTSVTLIFVFEN